MKELASIFTAKPKSVFDMLCQDEKTGFYMPAYQRPYSWTDRNIKDLFNDLDNVYRRLINFDDAIIFLGSLLAVNDDGSAIFPKVENQYPPSIKLVIDGQQRLTTLTIITSILNEQLRTKFSFLKSDIENKQHSDKMYSALERLEELVLEAISDTSKFVITTSARHDVYKYQPKIIRSQVDCWGKDEKSAEYNSPLANFLIKYQTHIIEQEKNNRFKEFDEKTLKSEEKTEQNVVGNIKEIRKQLSRVMNGFYCSKLDKNTTEQESLIQLEALKADNFRESLDFAVDDLLYDYSIEEKYVGELLYLTSFTKFLLNRVCLTYVEVNSESYAFDMFEALNTTGEPLTALETFVPKVIEHIQGTEEETERELTLTSLNSINSRFEGITKPAEKNKLTKSLILGYVRAYTGSVKVTHLRDQRDAFLQSFAKCPKALRSEYVDQLRFTSDFIFDHWQPTHSVPQVKGLVSSQNLDLATVCFRYLTDIKHDIVISVLVQFALKDQRNERNGIDSLEFFEALKTITAFSVLWRAMSGGADGIDTVYKQLHERAFEFNETEYKPFRLEDGFINIKLDVLKKFFAFKLEEKIGKKGSVEVGMVEQWLDVCSSQLHLAKPDNQKMLILSAFHNMEFSEGNFVRSDEERNNFFNLPMWNKLSEKDIVGTVFSKSNEDLSEWSPELRDIEVNQKLGNVLIDPRGTLKTKALPGWKHIAGRMQDALNDDLVLNIDEFVKAEHSEEGEQQAASLKLIRKYSEIVYTQEWNEVAVKQRTTALLHNAWINLRKWLD
ncbi:hypothetical protein BCT86_00845 [Vibrio breoganii]|uniref:DUF262 domain-containing protein n=1 Tax=Vibrio breoganii TaxID=553239 RepID=UPI000C8379EC|nr:DUF262 domain-containing protein [Vibrio breoganii]PML10548.1 hypothetical protein BCT86_00845 [Vibrio breoganii]